MDRVSSNGSSPCGSFGFYFWTGGANGRVAASQLLNQLKRSDNILIVIEVHQSRDKTLRKIAVPQPIEGRLVSEIEVACNVCGDIGWIRVDDMDLAGFESGDAPPYVCLKHIPTEPEVR